MSASLLLRRGMQKKMDLINRKFSVNYGHFLIKLLYFFQIEGKPPGCSDFIVVICDLICMPYFREALGSRWPQGDKVAWHDLTPGQHRQHSNTVLYIPWVTLFDRHPCSHSTQEPLDRSRRTKHHLNQGIRFYHSFRRCRWWPQVTSVTLGGHMTFVACVSHSAHSITKEVGTGLIETKTPPVDSAYAISPVDVSMVTSGDLGDLERSTLCFRRLAAICHSITQELLGQSGRKHYQ